MNTNIFEFKNNEILMQFNPLFLPANNVVDNSGSIKTFKLSNSSYLFSDIIKVFVGTDIAQNPLEMGAAIPQENLSQQIPAGNFLAFNIPINNFPAGIKEQLNNGSSLIGLKAILGMFGQLSGSGTVISDQANNSNQLDTSINEKLVNIDKLRKLLYNIFNYLNKNNLTKTDKADNSNSKEDKSERKNEISNEIKSLISQIMNSLKANKPVTINFNSNQETLKLEILQPDIQNSNRAFNGINNSANTNVQSGESLNLEITDHNLLIDVEKVPSILENNDSIRALRKVSAEPLNNTFNISDKLGQSISKNGYNTIHKSGLGSAEKLEFSKSTVNNSDLPESGLFNIKLKIISLEKSSDSINPQLKADISKITSDKTLNTSINNVSDSLSVEDLIASKSNMKGINKLLNHHDSGSLKIIGSRNNSAPGNENSGNNIQIEKNSANEESVYFKNDSFISASDFKGNVSIKIKSNSAAEKQSVNGDLNNENLEKGQNLQNLSKKENSNQKISGLEIQSSVKEKEIPQDSQLSSDKSLENQAGSKENVTISSKQQDSKINSADSMKTTNSGKVNINETQRENGFNENLAGNKHNTQDNTNEQGQFSQVKVEGLFSSYMNKINLSNVQNVRKPVYLDNFSEQMKQIDSSEIVKEISKLASNSDQKNVVLKLMPESLGKVKISLDINKNIIHAHAEVENEAARTLMQNNVDNLRQSLVQQGLQLNSLNIFLSNQQEQKSNKPFQSKRKPVYTEKLNEADQKDHINISKHYGYNTYEYLA